MITHTDTPPIAMELEFDLEPEPAPDPPPRASLRRIYLEWVDERIEAYKESLRRDALLELADEVVRELEVSRRGQYQITEVLLAVAMDRKIFRLLELPGFKPWRDDYLAGGERRAGLGL